MEKKVSDLTVCLRGLLFVRSVFIGRYALHSRFSEVIV